MIEAYPQFNFVKRGTVCQVTGDFDDCKTGEILNVIDLRLDVAPFGGLEVIFLITTDHEIEIDLALPQNQPFILAPDQFLKPIGTFDWAKELAVYKTRTASKRTVRKLP